MRHTAANHTGAAAGRGCVLQPATYRGLLEASMEAVAVVAGNGQVLFSNPAHDDLFGSVAGDWLALWPPAAQATLRAVFARLRTGGPVWEDVLEAADRMGRPVALRLRATILSQRAGTDAPVQVHLLPEPPSPARFLASASHDMRQPLQALTMFVAVLSSRQHSPADRKLIGRIEEALAATDAAVSNLVEFSRLESGLLTPAAAPMSAGGLLARLDEEYRPAADHAGLDLRVVPCRTLVVSDVTLLERLLRHLLSNALQFTHRGRILLGCRRRGQVLRFEVWDSGPGLTEDQIAAAFHAFRRLDTPGRGRQGLGLGLAIVDRLGRLLGHPVTVRRHRQGLAVSVEVPLAEG